MPKASFQIYRPAVSRDETDRIPKDLSISNFDIFMYVIAIVGHFVDLGLDINVAVRYSLANKMVEFGWTLTFILLPAFVNTLVSMRMYTQDKELQSETLTNTLTRQRWLRILILVLQMAPIMRLTDALIFAIKSRRAQHRKDEASQRMYYSLMLKEDSDAALLRIFECFLEAAPQQVLQTSLLFRHHDYFKVHQMLSICSSIIGMGWCLAGYQRAIRFAQQDKLNMTWFGSFLQVIWHFFVTLSRIMCISMIAYLYPMWTVVACIVHIFVMSVWLQICDRSPFCSSNKFGEVAFSLSLGAVYLFTYILPIEGRTRFRYAVYYTLCFIQNLTCTVLWYFYADDNMRIMPYFHLILILSIVPYVIGILFMLVYYMFFHPKVKIRRGVRDSNVITVTFKSNEQAPEVS